MTKTKTEEKFDLDGWRKLGNILRGDKKTWQIIKALAEKDLPMYEVGKYTTPEISQAATYKKMKDMEKAGLIYKEKEKEGKTGLKTFVYKPSTSAILFAYIFLNEEEDDKIKMTTDTTIELIKPYMITGFNVLYEIQRFKKILKQHLQSKHFKKQYKLGSLLLSTKLSSKPSFPEGLEDMILEDSPVSDSFSSLSDIVEPIFGLGIADEIAGDCFTRMLRIKKSWDEETKKEYEKILISEKKGNALKQAYETYLSFNKKKSNMFAGNVKEQEKYLHELTVNKKEKKNV